MRRVLAFVLSVLFVTQPAAAAPLNAASVTLSLSKGVQPVISAVQATWLFAVVTGSESRYQALHAPIPHFAPPTGIIAHPQFLRSVHRTAAVMSARAGMPGAPPAMRTGVLPKVQLPVDPLALGLARKQRMPGAIRGAQIHAMTGSMTPSTTGINRYWTYEERPIAGVGSAMVNVGNGNVIVQANDIDVPERGIDLAFRRSYNSQSNHDSVGTDGATPGLFGDGWTNNFDVHLAYNSALNIISVYDGDGARYDYAANPSQCTTQTGYQCWTPPAGMQGTILASDGGNGYYWIKKNGTVYYLWSPVLSGSMAGYAGRTYQIFGRNQNNSITFSYTWNAQGSTSVENVSTITAQHSDGQSVMMQFGTCGTYARLMSISRPDKQSVTYQYDGNCNLQVVTRPGNAQYPSLPETYGYVAGTHELQWAGGPRYVLSQTNDGSTVGFVYDANSTSGKLTLINSYGLMNFAPSDDGTGVPLQSGSATPNSLWRWERFTYQNQQTVFDDSQGHSTTWAYDNLWRVTQTSDSTGSTPLVTSEQWEDTNNNLVATTDARNNTTQYGYDGQGNTTYVWFPSVQTSLGTGRPIERFSYDGNNNLTAYCDQNYIWSTGITWCPTTGATTHYTYDFSDPNEQYGKLTDTFSPMGYHQHISYDSYGEPTSVTAAQSISQPDGSSRTPTQTFTYDPLGNLLTYNNGVGTWTLSYNGMNQPLTHTDPDGHESFTYYNLDGSVSESETPLQHAHGWGSTVTYDADGDVTSSTIWRQTAAGATATKQTTTKWYDGEDRLVEVRQPQDSSADAYNAPWLTRYLYDLTSGGQVSYNGTSFYAHGNLYKTQEYLPSAAIAGPVTATAATAQSIAATTWVDLKGTAFDALDRPVAKYSMVNVNGAASDQLSIETMTYDGTSRQHALNETGLLNSYCNNANQCSYNENDALGHLTDVVFTDPSLSPERQATFDPDGRMATRTSSHGTEYFTYDNDGHETSYQEATGGGVTDPAKFTHEYYLDGSLKQLDVVSSTLNQNGLFQYSYQADGRVQTQTIEDEALANVGATSVHLQYYPSGRLKQRTESGPGANPNTGTWQYDGNGNLSGMTPMCASCSNMTMAGLTYGPDGSLLGPSPFTYTARGELRTAAILSTTYFANGTNVSFQTGQSGMVGGTTNTWDARTGAQLSSSTQFNDPTEVKQSSSNSATFTYDQAGRMTSEATTSESTFTTSATTTRGYDDENHTAMTSVTNSTLDGTTTGMQSLEAYDWGANGHPVRIGSATSSTMPASVPQNQYETLHWDGDQLIFTSNASGTVDDIKIGTGGDITPLDPNFKGLTFYDRGPGGQINYCHNVTGLGGTPTIANGSSAGAVAACGAPAGVSMPTSFLWTDAARTISKIPTHIVGIGQGKLLGMYRGDGITDGFNTIQGVRTMDSAAGTWTTPDAYAGEVHDPASQKSYMWNGNNAVSYSDPSGYSPNPPTEPLFYDDSKGPIDTGDPMFTKVMTLTSTDGSASGVEIAAVNSPSIKLSNGHGKFKNADVLEDHFKRHGGDFGSKSAGAYEEEAAQFFQKALEDGLPMKADNGVTRVYDPRTNTFGSYDMRTGTIKTYFKPSGGASYFARQPGNLLWSNNAEMNRFMNSPANRAMMLRSELTTAIEEDDD